VERPWGTHFECHTWGEYTIPNCNTMVMMQAIRHDYPNRRLIVFPDPTGNARTTTGATTNVGETDHTIIRSFGGDIFVPKFKSVADKYNTVNGMMLNSYGLRRKLINPTKCKMLVRGYDGLCYKEGTNMADKTSGLDHITDADAYMMLGAFPMVTATVSVGTVSM